MKNAKVIKVEKVKKRIWEIDFLRGLSIFLLLFDHTFCALYTFGEQWFPIAKMSMSATVRGYGFFEMIKAMASGQILGGESFALRLCYFSKYWWVCSLRSVAQPLFAGIFIAICGASCTLSHNNLKRGLILLCIADLLTLGSNLFTKPEVINFGVLHLLSVAILLFELLNVLFKGDRRSLAITSAALCVILTVLFFVLRNSKSFLESYNAETGIFKNVLFNTKNSAHFNPTTSYNNALHFSPTDYFPLLPWLAVFMFGASFGKIFYADKKSLLPRLDGKWNKPLCAMGRYTIWFYLGQPVVVYGILMLVSYFKMTPGSWGII